MAPSRLAAVFLAVIAIHVSAAQTTASPVPAPPGYRLVGAEDVREETQEFPTGPLDRERVTGLRWQLLYDALPGLTRSPLDILRHYVTTAERRGGFRLFGYVDDLGGKVTAFVPAARPLWIEATPGDNGAGIEVVIVEETVPVVRKLAVPAERIPGRWVAPVFNLSVYAPADRADVTRVFNEVAAHWRAAAALVPPMGAGYRVAMAPMDEVGPRGPAPMDFQLIAGIRYQACAACAISEASESRRLVGIAINDPAKAADPAIVSGPDGTEWFAWRPVRVESPTMTRTRDGRVLLTLENRPPLWLPVSREAFLTAQVAALDRTTGSIPDAKKVRDEQEAAIREIEKIDPAAAKVARAALAAAPAMGDVRVATNPLRAQLIEELTRLSPEDRRKPAVQDDGGQVVLVNPAYFQPGGARARPHVAVVTLSDAQDYFLVDLIDRLKSVDWRWLVGER
jgi:hypothetical protein